MSEELKPCPCGKTPKILSIQDGNQGGKYNYVMGDCCSEWMTEFRANYTAIDSSDCYKLAVAAWNNTTRAYEAEIEALKDELKDAHQQTGLAKIDLDHKNVLLLSCEKALEDRDILNASLKQKLSVALEALKIGHDCAIKLTDFDEIPLADRRYSGIEVIARAIQQVEGNEPYPLQLFKKKIVGTPDEYYIKQMWPDGSWREIEINK